MAQVLSNSAAVMSLSGVVCDRLTMPAASTAPWTAPKCSAAASKAPAMLPSSLQVEQVRSHKHHPQSDPSVTNTVMQWEVLLLRGLLGRCGADLTSQWTKCALSAPTSATSTAPASASRSAMATLPSSDAMRRVTAAPILQWAAAVPLC